MRDVEIAAVSARDELVSVVRAGMAITAGVWLYLANNPFPDAGGGALQRTLLPFQTVIQTRPLEEQRIFRELQVSLLEAETMRSVEGAWPDARRLADEGIEPFAPNPALKGPDYVWTEMRSGRIVNYLGIPRGGQQGSEPAPAWLVLVQEPDPAAPPEVYVEDEEHDRLADGSILHVSIWSHADGARASARLVQVPQAEGWTQIYAADRAGR
jgi:hypothetical protein